MKKKLKYISLITILNFSFLIFPNVLFPNVTGKTVIAIQQQINAGKADFQPYKFIFFGDTQQSASGDNSGPLSVYNLLKNVTQENKIEFILHAGDCVERSALQSEWDTYFWPSMSPILENITMYVAVGNHDYKGAGDKPAGIDTFLANVENPGNEIYYSFNSQYNDTHFIVLNSEYYFDEASPTRQEAQQTWLENDLQENTIERVVVMFHRPMWGVHPGYVHTSDEPLREIWHEFLVEHGVDLVLNGHHHLFYTTIRNGVRFVVSGGGATTLVKPIPNHPDIPWQEGDVCLEGNHICLFETTETGFNVDVIMTNGTIAHTFTIDAPIYDTTPPTITSLGDVVAYEETSGSNVSWLASDANPDYYSIYQNDQKADEGPWMTGRPIYFLLDNLTTGTYSFRAHVWDMKGFTANATSVVQIKAGKAPWDTEVSKETPGFGILSVLVLLTILGNTNRFKKFKWRE